MPAPQWEDDLNVGSCAQVSSYKCSVNYNDDDCFVEVADIRNKISGPFAKEFGKDQQYFTDMSLNMLGLHADIIFAENFEGVPGGGRDFTEEDWETMYRMLNSLLLAPFSNHTR